VLAEEAVKSAVWDYYKKNGIDKEIPGFKEGCVECDDHHGHDEE
jgi:hypothetical protein